MQNPAAEQVIKTLKDANCVLVTVKNSPSVDELTAAIGLTLLLNHMGKHAVTVFSGYVPSTLEFLQPETAIDTNTDSLRDFIIALDKSKADKLRYKVEDNVVRIFITPYKSSISEKDLDFSQGEFNVDVVVALGVITKDDFDQAVTTHGRILHDATVVALTAREAVSEIGAINWQEQQASGVSEMIASIADQLGEDALDGQIATALLTGMVAETDRFKNSFTTPQVLSLSSRLMSAGANQQLIAEKLEEPDVPVPIQEEKIDTGSGETSDGVLEITHDEEEIQNIEIDDNGNLQLPDEPPAGVDGEIINDGEQVQADNEPKEEPLESASHTYMDPKYTPPLFGQDDSGVVTAQPLFTAADAPVQAGSTSSHAHDGSVGDDAFLSARSQKVIEPIEDTMQDSAKTLAELEQALESPHVESTQDQQSPQDTSINVDEFLGTTQVSDAAQVPAESTPQLPQAPPAVVSQQAQPTQEESEEAQKTDPNAPPVVPPPLLPQAPAQPQFFDADGNNQNPFLNPSN
jgi:hypothetical protein